MLDTFISAVLNLIKFEEISHYFLNLREFEKYQQFINNPFVLCISDLPSEDNLFKEQFIDSTNDIRVALVKTKPNIEEPVKPKQMQPSN